MQRSNATLGGIVETDSVSCSTTARDHHGEQVSRVHPGVLGDVAEVGVETAGEIPDDHIGCRACCTTTATPSAPTTTPPAAAAAPTARISRAARRTRVAHHQELRVWTEGKGRWALGVGGLAGGEVKQHHLVPGRLISVEHGLLLVTGPTGSGKSTTLYAALQEINSVAKNVLTLEDPIEYELEGISQTQVSGKKGMTFASGLRSVLRQDPDIIMVGEIRDHETAVMAIQSALTGHLVFSTLHTNDSASAVS